MPLHGNVLVTVEGGITEAICAEPVIRRLAKEAAGQCTITVCQKHADLYAGHAAVQCAIYDEEESNAQKFDVILKLSVPKGEMTLWQCVDAYAMQTKIKLNDNRPHLALNGYDLIRAQRFGICTLKKPKVAVAISQSIWESHGQLWQQFSEHLCGQSECSVVVLGQIKLEFPATKNLGGKLTSRETAAVLSQCDILVTTEGDYAALAVSVRIPAVLVGSAVPSGRDEFAGLLRTDTLSVEQVLSVMRQWSDGTK